MIIFSPDANGLFFFFFFLHALSKHPDHCHTDKQKTKKIKGTKYKHFQYNIFFPHY